MKKPDPRKLMPAQLNRTYRKVRSGISSRQKINAVEGQRPLQLTMRGRTIELGQVDSATYVLAAALTIFLLIVLIGGGKNASGATEETTTEATRGVVEQTTTGSGSIESARDTDLSFETGGTVTRVLVAEGDRVKKSEAIARLDRRSAKLAVEVAKANLEAAEAGTSTTAVSLQGNSSETQIVTAAYTGGVQTSFAASTAESVGATTGESDVVCEDDEVETINDSGLTTCVEIDTGTTGATGATGATGPAGSADQPDPENDSEAGSGGELPSSGGSASGDESAAGGGSVSGATSGGGTSSSATSSVSETDVKAAELALENARQDLQNTILRAPFGGTIVSLEGAVGDSVSAGSSSSAETDTSGTQADTDGTDTGSTGASSAFAVIQSLDALEMSVDVAEAEVNAIEEGQRATVTISSADDESLAAEVTGVGLLASTDTSGVVTYPVTVSISQTSAEVRPGMSATVAIVTDQVSGAITVPNQAVSGGTVEIRDSGGETESVIVETGLVGDSSTEIVSGLDAGDTVVIPQVEITTDSGETGDERSATGLGGGAADGGGPPGGAAAGGGRPGAG
ncbi:MAG: HlyD family efflux transporter periplasmic adaptor subunit [Solirubrobacterales bacterium]